MQEAIYKEETIKHNQEAIYKDTPTVVDTNKKVSTNEKDLEEIKKLVKALDLDSIAKKMEEFQNTFNQNIEKVNYKQVFIFRPLKTQPD